MNFQSPQQLEEWLSNHKIDTSHWGSGTAKRVTDLWHELASGDSELLQEPPLRKVQVVTLHVYQNDRQLIEAVQTFHDGRKRVRNRPPSEKIKRGETAKAAALRCLQEEVGCTTKNILSPPHLLKTESTHSDSPSYPTLPSQFTVTLVSVHVIGLPTDDFSTENRAENDPVRSTEWCWTS